MLALVPKELITKEIAMAALQEDGQAVCFVPKELIITKEIAMAALQQPELALPFVPKELITKEIAMAAVQQDGWALEFVPKELIEEIFSMGLAEFLVKWDGKILKYIPEELKTVAICAQAVLNDPLAEAFVPETIRTLLDDPMRTTGKLTVQGETLSLPTTGPLPEPLQLFVDKYLSTPLYDPVSQGFIKLASGSVKHTWVHPELPGYVLKLPHEEHFKIEDSNAAMAKDVSTMLHLKRIVAENSLNQILIPTSYVLVNGQRTMILQERVEVTGAEGFYTQQLSTLIQEADKSLYPEIDERSKKQLKQRAVSLVQKLLNRASKKYTQWELQFLQRSWIWDLAPERAHNAGLVAYTKDLPDSEKLLAILDGAL